MSVPHLDKRIVDGHGYLMFGPYATFSTKLLKHGRSTDFFTTLRWHNLHVIAAAILQNLSLIAYLVTQLTATRAKKVGQLHRYYPGAVPDHWELIAAGQRAQLITPDPKRIGAIQQGTELVVSADGTIAGLLGASPGASTAVPIMLELLQRCFPHHWQTNWADKIAAAIPGSTHTTWTTPAVNQSANTTASLLQLDSRATRKQAR